MFKEFFYMHKSDRRVILALLAVGAVVLAVVSLTEGKEEKVPISSIADTISLSHKERRAEEQRHTEKVLAPFDPNTADSTQLLQLGLSPRIVSNIYRYRQAGGIFSEKKDFAQMYGLTVSQYQELEPYITIAREYRPASTLFPKQSRQAARHDDVHRDSTFVPRYPVKIAPGETIDLATADTAQLQTVPGIGPYYARRIVDYRKRLGGFVSVDQLDEIEDFPSSAKAFFHLGTTVIQRININALSLNELKRHPYINFRQARAITDYRRLYGPISDLHDLSLSPDFPEEAIARLLPYVEY